MEDLLEKLNVSAGSAIASLAILIVFVLCVYFGNRIKKNDDDDLVRKLGSMMKNLGTFMLIVFAAVWPVETGRLLAKPNFS